MAPFHTPLPEPGSPAAAVHTWVASFVVPLALCPFARAAMPGLRVVSADAANAVARSLSEARLLADADPAHPATTLVVVDRGLEDFEQYLDVVERVERALDTAGLEGVVQVASFHPEYRFAGEPEDDPAAYTNRTPFPAFHLLREDDVTAAVDTHPDPHGIPARNQQLLRSMGLPDILRALGRAP
jgi:hypothetical protein